MKHLHRIVSLLKDKQSARARAHNWTGDYYLPEAWNTFGYLKFNRIGCRAGEINVNPYDFLLHVIENHLLTGSSSTKSHSARTKGADLMKGAVTENIVFSMFPRAFTAWDHYHDGSVCSGSFLKAIALLPYLQVMQVEIIYLLPIFEHSEKYPKGNLGSPYAIKNIYELDHHLHDPLLDGEPREMAPLEFKAFVEACHLMGIRVMVDFVFRTVARDSELIIDHPDWFYWIRTDFNQSFTVPGIDGEKELLPLTTRNLKAVYQAPATMNYLDSHTVSPRELDPAKWEILISQSRESGMNHLDLIEKEFGITTAPGFSNMINDPQPPWTDVTFLRFYHDSHPLVKKWVSGDRPPFILQDGICLNLYPGQEVNKELWDYVAGVIPYYQKEFGIDGARIDMGHALPVELNRTIISRAKTGNPDFILWSEEFDVRKSGQAGQDGFHFVSGAIWMNYKHLEKRNFNRLLFSKTLLASELPVTAALETPDTPRLGYIVQEKRKIEFLIWLNCFLPNAVVFLNNGLELLERQPMNLGLDNSEAGRYVLDESDPFYGKLAFFDRYCFHWLTQDQSWMRGLLAFALQLRRQYAGLIAGADHFIPRPELDDHPQITQITYYDPPSKKGLLLLGNRDFRRAVDIDPEIILSDGIDINTTRLTIIYSTARTGSQVWNIEEIRQLSPGEVVIAEINNSTLSCNSSH